MISLAVFDMAGTTVNDGGAVYRALEQAVTETGVPVTPEHLQSWMGTEKRAAITALIELGGGDPFATADKVDTAFERFQTILGELYAAHPPVPVEGAAEAITELRASGTKVALTTGFSRDVANAVLDRLDWGVGGESRAATVVDALVCGDEVAAGRPAPYMIHRAMERTGTLAVDQLIVAGDTVVDVEAGAHAGAGITVGVLTGELQRADFAGTPATVVLDSVTEIPAMLQRASHNYLVGSQV